MKKVKVGVIAAAGKGTRAYPRTSFIPKPLFLVNNKSILSHNVALMQEKFGVEKIYILVGHLKEQVIEEIERMKYEYPKISIEPCDWTTKGLASDVASLESKITAPFITILGDEFYYKTDHENFLTTLKSHPDLLASIGVVYTPIISRIRKNYSVELDGDRIVNLVEKPENPPNNMLGLGSYLFTPAYFEYFRKTPPAQKSGVVEITEVIDKMAKESGKVYMTPVHCTYYNINSMQDYHQAVYEIRHDLFDNYKVSLIIPTKNNERSLPDVITDFKDKVHEIVIVDGNSTDKTASIAKEFKTQLEMYYSPDGNENEGVKIREGIEKATGDIIVVVSADGAFRSKDLLKLLEYVKDCDMVIGTRTTRQMIEQGSNLKAFSRLVNLILGKIVEVFWWGQEPRFTDVDCKFFAVWKDSYSKIKSRLTVKNESYPLEMMIEIVRSHMRCIEVPISYFNPVEKEHYRKRTVFKKGLKALRLALSKKKRDYFPDRLED